MKIKCHNFYIIKNKYEDMVTIQYYNCDCKHIIGNKFHVIKTKYENKMSVFV